MNKNTTTNLISSQDIINLNIIFSLDILFSLFSLVLMTLCSCNQPLKSRGLTPFLMSIIITLRMIILIITQFSNNCSLPILSGV